MPQGTYVARCLRVMDERCSNLVELRDTLAGEAEAVAARHQHLVALSAAVQERLDVHEKIREALAGCAAPPAPAQADAPQNAELAVEPRAGWGEVRERIQRAVRSLDGLDGVSFAALRSFTDLHPRVLSNGLNRMRRDGLADYLDGRWYF